MVLLCLTTCKIIGQETFPINGINDTRSTFYAFIHARIVVDYQSVIGDGTVVIKNGAIHDVGMNIPIPAGSVIIDLKGKSIYPSFIDPYTDYGIPELKTKAKEGQGQQFLSNTKGAYDWNQAIRPEIDASKYFVSDSKKAELFRNAGIGTVMSLNKDGICRGTSMVVLLSDEKENLNILEGKVAQCFSFEKGSSTQDYPDSRMGAIALLRQTYYDATWYKQSTKREYNISLEAFNENQKYPSIFEVSDWQNVLRADKIGDEFNIQYIIKGSGYEYQRIEEIKKTGATFIIPVNYPETYDVSDPWDAINVSLSDMKHWELAPTNASQLEKAGIAFCFTTDGLKDKKDFMRNIRKALDNGLSEQSALKALTYTPAVMLNIQNKTGSIKKGMVANFIITSKSIFDKENVIFENWCNGKRYIIKNINAPDLRGYYTLFLNNKKAAGIRVTGEMDAPQIFFDEDTNKTKGNISFAQEQLLLSYESKNAATKGLIKLNGYIDQATKTWKGSGYLQNGQWTNWYTVFDSTFIATAKIDSAKKDTIKNGNLWLPNMAYGWEKLPTQKTVVIKNTTVWTNESDGNLINTDVLIKNGKIALVGKNINEPGAEVIDGTGKHLTAGIIDEHSHIAVSGAVNECTQSVTAEVRIADVIDCEDVNIYRQLAGGVTSSHLLHGSCNPVGGQTQLIKLRYGLSSEELKFANWPGFIKFALGENVKQSNAGDNNTSRYPQTRMGVEQTYYNAFTRALDYQKAIKSFNALSTADRLKAKPVRKDLELDALAEIINGKRFITCHSYVQSEINMLMHVADSFHFQVNTFTHILEGYKVADKMKAHGAGASSFSDWWAYKYEVYEAIPYNGKILHDVGVTVAYNSDDAEMARRLNQEAAKAVKYGGVSEQEAWKFVTLNPAKLLHVDDKVGSIKVGKDADVVLWSDNPLSIYAKVEHTFVDGICYYDKETDKLKQKAIADERARLIQKMTEAKNKGANAQPPSFKAYEEKHCTDIEHMPFQN